MRLVGPASRSQARPRAMAATREEGVGPLFPPESFERGATLLVPLAPPLSLVSGEQVPLSEGPGASPQGERGRGRGPRLLRQRRCTVGFAKGVTERAPETVTVPIGKWTGLLWARGTRAHPPPAPLPQPTPAGAPAPEPVPREKQVARRRPSVCVAGSVSEWTLSSS